VPQVAPTLTDPVAANASQVLGGPLGRWARSGSPARSLQIVLAGGALAFGLGALRTLPCALDGWSVPARYQALCYSDIPILYTLRGIADGGLPYLDNGTQPLEYPVLTGLFTWFAGLFVAPDNAAGYYWVSVLLLLACFLVALAATAMTVSFRVWDGLLLALAPSVFLASCINWDWLAVGLTAVALLAWSRERPVIAGVFLGLAIAAKFYPLLLLGPLALLCWRRRRLAALARTAAAAALAWLVVNLPFALASPDGWSYFFRFSSERGQDFGSVWLALSILGWQVDPDALNLVLGDRRTHPRAPPAAPTGPGGLPGRGRVSRDQQGVLPAVRAVAAAVGRAGAAAVEGFPDLAGGRGRLLRRHLVVPRGTDPGC
jgi:hypothetical protein